MKYYRWLGTLALIAFITSGCGTQAKEQAVSGSSSSSSQPSQQQQDKQQKAANNPQQRQMTMTFQTLVRMDKTEGLSITKEQAQQMLPVVQDSITKGELTSDNQTKLVEKLTAEQKKFLDEAAAQRPAKQGESNVKEGSGNQAPSEEQLKKMEEAKQKRNQQKADSATDANNAGNEDKAKQPKAEDRPNGGNPGHDKNSGEQLVELLQTKLK